MRTYWAVQREDGSIGESEDFDGIGIMSVHPSQILAEEAAKFLHRDALEVAIVPAAALKGLVEAVEEEISKYPHITMESIVAIKAALSEWKGGAE